MRFEKNNLQSHKPLSVSINLKKKSHAELRKPKKQVEKKQQRNKTIEKCDNIFETYCVNDPKQKKNSFIKI